MDQAAQDEKTAKATAKRGAEVQAQTAEWAQEKARTEAALASAAQAKAEQQRSQQAMVLALTPHGLAYPRLCVWPGPGYVCGLPNDIGPGPPRRPPQ